MKKPNIMKHLNKLTMLLVALTLNTILIATNYIQFNKSINL